MKQFVFVEDGKCYRGSSAALHIARHLRWPFPIMFLFLAVPPFIRDGGVRVTALDPPPPACTMPKHQVTRIVL